MWGIYYTLPDTLYSFGVKKTGFYFESQFFFFNVKYLKKRKDYLSNALSIQMVFSYSAI